jgi:hypothetical protein
VLTDAEQRRLEDIEFWLHTDDPDFVQRFKGEGGHRPGSRRPVILITGAVTLALILFITYGIAGVLFVAFVGLLVTKYLAHRYIRTHLPTHYERHGDHMD